MPSSTRCRRASGFSGVMRSATRARPRWPRPDARTVEPRLAYELRIGERVQIRRLLQDAGFEENVRRVLVELLKLAGEKLLVGGLVLPAQIRGRLAELLARLLGRRAHDLVALGRVLANHVDRLEVTVRERLSGFRIVGEEFGRAAERVHDHRIVEG